MFDSFFPNIEPLSSFDVLINILLSVALGFIISVIYRLTYKGYSYSSSFVTTLILISMITSLVIMVIGNNLARAFGLVGAMSIIRFRTAVKDTRDTAFVFFALGTGLAAGAGNYMIGIIGTFIGCIVTLLLFYTNYGIMKQEEFLLRFSTFPEGDMNTEAIYLPLFTKYLSKHTLLNMRTVRLGQMIELTFEVRLKNPQQSKEFINDLSKLEGIERVSLSFGEKTSYE